MLIIGCDFHTRYQKIAMANAETGELLLERRLDHQRLGPRRQMRSKIRVPHPSSWEGGLLDFSFFPPPRISSGPSTLSISIDRW